MNHLDKEYLVTKKKKEEEYVFSRIDYPNRYVSWLPETYFDLMGIINYTHHGHKKAKTSMIAEPYIFKVPLYFDHYGKNITFHLI